MLRSKCIENVVPSYRIVYHTTNSEKDLEY